jgi:hypothetical protein
MKNARTFFNERKEDSTIDDKMQTGFNNFVDCLDSYLDLFENSTINEESQIKIYGSVTLENGAIVRATNNFYGRAWFSNIAISMSFEESNDYTLDQGVCYGQVTYILKLLYLSVCKS